jgi:hypothetical protein
MKARSINLERLGEDCWASFEREFDLIWSFFEELAPTLLVADTNESPRGNVGLRFSCVDSIFHAQSKDLFLKRLRDQSHALENNEHLPTASNSQILSKVKYFWAWLVKYF